MDYVDCAVMAVPEAHRADYIEKAKVMADLFLECGASEVVDCWGSDVPEGKLTSFPMAVKRAEGEVVVFSWIKWPSSEVRAAGWERAMADPRMSAGNPNLFDGKRMIYGGFDMIQSKRKEA
jgi:uncharacterized protein YbaA (DUF1428 family)